MSWENVHGVFHTHKENGISVCEVSLHFTPDDPEDHAEHDDSYYWVGWDCPPDDVVELLKEVGLSDEYYGKKVVVCVPRNNTLRIECGQASVEPDFFGCSEDIYWFDDAGKCYEWELNYDTDEWEKVYE